MVGMFAVSDRVGGAIFGGDGDDRGGVGAVEGKGIEDEGDFGGAG